MAFYILLNDGYGNDNAQHLRRLAAQTLEEAHEEAREYILKARFGEEYKDPEVGPRGLGYQTDFYHEQCFLFDVADVVEIDLDNVIADFANSYQKQEADRREAVERALYEKLKTKFEK